MGEVRVEIDLENAFDRELVRRGQLPEQDVRSARIRALADSGSIMLMLPQDLVEALGLREVRKAIVRGTNKRQQVRPVAQLVTVRVADRATESDCVVGPPDSEPLIGRSPLAAMDLHVDIETQQLIPRPESPFLPLLNLK